MYTILTPSEFIPVRFLFVLCFLAAPFTFSQHEQNFWSRRMLIGIP